MNPVQQAIVDYQQEYNIAKLLSGNKLTPLASKKYVNDISKSLEEMFKFYYISGRAKVNESLKKEIAKYDKKEAEKITFSEIDDVIGKEYRPKEAIKNLVNQLEIKEGEIYKTRLDIDLLLQKAKQIAILSYSDYVARVNTKLLVALEDYKGTPYKKFIKLLESDQIKNMAVKDLVDVKGYWQTVFRTNVSTMFHAGYLDQVEEVKEYVAFEEYVALIREHEQCKALSGQVAKVGEFEANGNSIPSGYNCTAYFNIISKVRAKATGIKETKWDRSKRPGEGFGGKTNSKKVSELPKTVKNRLPSGYNKLL